MIKTPYKFILLATGPMLLYRLDIIRKVCPGIVDYLIIFTDSYSYDLYKSHHDCFHFVLMDEYRADDQFSLEHERILHCETDVEFISAFSEFYGRDKGLFFPWEIHRFVFPYLIENNITKFALTQTDFILRDSVDLINKFSDSIPDGSFTCPRMGKPCPTAPGRAFLEIQDQFPEITFSYDGDGYKYDGFFSGFNFKNIEDMNLFYNVWNTAIRFPILSRVTHISLMSHTDHIAHQLMYIFCAQRGYNIYDPHSFFRINRQLIGCHKSRIEDTIYVFKSPRKAWENLGFDYSDTTSISGFIKNNKSRFQSWYGPLKTDVTDTHVYTALT